MHSVCSINLAVNAFANTSKNVIVTRTAKGGLAIAVWNLVDPDQHGSTRTVELVLRGISLQSRATLQIVDDEHGNVLKAYAGMGKPLDPTWEQVEQLNRATALPAPRSRIESRDTADFPGSKCSSLDSR
jgi:xylan 1,4-beta-xylosidase